MTYAWVLLACHHVVEREQEALTTEKEIAFDISVATIGILMITSLLD